jgi:hypothetical protein
VRFILSAVLLLGISCAQAPRLTSQSIADNPCPQYKDPNGTLYEIRECAVAVTRIVYSKHGIVCWKAEDAFERVKCINSQNGKPVPVPPDATANLNRR